MRYSMKTLEHYGYRKHMGKLYDQSNQQILYEIACANIDDMRRGVDKSPKEKEPNHYRARAFQSRHNSLRRIDSDVRRLSSFDEVRRGYTICRCGKHNTVLVMGRPMCPVYVGANIIRCQLVEGNHPLFSNNVFNVLLGISGAIHESKVC